MLFIDRACFHVEHQADAIDSLYLLPWGGLCILLFWGIVQLDYYEYRL